MCQVVFCGGSSHISAFTEQIKSLHEICLLAEHIKANVILSYTRLREDNVSNNRKMLVDEDVKQQEDKSWRGLDSL